jgi:histidinol-phosphate aminotransferase
MSCDPLALAVPGVRALEPYQPGKPIEELEREFGIADVIKLASNENPLGPSPRARAAIEAALAGIARYPDGGGSGLRRALAAKFGLAPEQVTLGNGSNDVLECAARAFAGPGDEVLFSQHAFAVYPIVTQAVGARAVATSARDWGHDLDAMRRALSARTKLVFIANPNNPTGRYLNGAELKNFLAAVPTRTIVVVDEAYFEYVEAPDYPDASAWLAEHPNLIVTRTFSKAHGLAGLRVGYGLASPGVSELLNRVRQPFNVNSLAQQAALAALDDEAHVARARALNRDGLRRLADGFRALGLPWIASVGNFVCVEVGDAAAVYQRLLRAGVIVRPVANYGMPRHLRVTVGLPDENERFLEALGRILRERSAVSDQQSAD